MDSKEDVKADEVQWTVEEYAKDIDYFHDVIGLPKEGKIPKDITLDEVSAAALEKHFGVKDGKNGYKKEGIKGISAEYINRLCRALDGLEKFQQYTQEVARGLYWDCILKKPVNWAACGVDKHRGQLRLRWVRKTPPQFHLPPWKRVEHKFNAEDVQAERESEEDSQTGKMPSSVPRKALDSVETVQKRGTPKKTSQEEEEKPTLGLSSKKSLQVEPELEEQKLPPYYASPKQLTPTEEKKPPLPLSPLHKIGLVTDVGAQVADLVGGGSQGIGEEVLCPEKTPSLFQTGTRDGEARLTAIDTWLQIVEDSLGKLDTSQKVAHKEFSDFTARMKKVTTELKGITSRLTVLRSDQEGQKEMLAKLQAGVQEKVAEKKRLEEDIALLAQNLNENEDYPEAATDKEILDSFRSKLMECCSATLSMQVAITGIDVTYNEIRAEIQSNMCVLSEYDDQETFGKSTLRSLEETARMLTDSYFFLDAECSLLKKHLDRGAVYVRPIPILCPLQTEETSFSISECPVCSLGFFCHNWVPTPCGHCYHPSCLFPLLNPEDGGAPKCLACSQVFHRSWLQCWGSSKADHSQVIELADEWDLDDQASSFKNSLTEFYDNNALTIQGRRKHLEAKHQKVTIRYSRDIVKASTLFHENISRAGHVGLQCAAKSLGPPRNRAAPAGQSLGKRSGEAQIADGKKIKVDLSIVKFEKGSSPSTPMSIPEVGSVVDDLQVVTEATWSKKGKSGAKGTASSAPKGKMRTPTKEADNKSAKKVTPKATLKSRPKATPGATPKRAPTKPSPRGRGRGAAKRL